MKKPMGKSARTKPAQTDWRAWAARAARWGADYVENVGAQPVMSAARPGDTLAALPKNPPARGEAMDKIFADFARIVPPGLTHWQHPRFFAYFSANASPPSVIAEHLTAAMGAQCMLWQTSPAAAEMEARMMEWLARLFALPGEWRGVIQDSGTSSTLAAVLTARERALQWRGGEQGLSRLPPLRFYTSPHAHASVEKAARLAGIGRKNLITLPSGRGAARALARMAKADKRAGFLPAGLVATIGGTAFGGNDDLSALLPMAKKLNLFSHVDAAWAGAAWVCPEHRDTMAGIEHADSIVINPHKWLMTNFDCSAHFVKDPAALIKTMSGGRRANYLRVEDDTAADFSDWSIPLGRRFRALKLWFVIRHYGAAGLRKFVRNHIRWAGEAARLLGEDDNLEMVSPPSLSLFAFRMRLSGKLKGRGEAAANAATRRLLQTINREGFLYLSPAAMHGKEAIRFQVSQWQTTRRDVTMAARAIIRAARREVKNLEQEKSGENKRRI